MQRFENLNPASRPHGAGSVFRWSVWDRLRGHRRKSEPGPGAPYAQADLRRLADPAGPPRVTWIGHSSFLVTLNRATVLVDPVFSERIAVVYRRHTAPGLLPQHLPPLDALLISHNHYDHLDIASIKALARGVPVIVPRGLGAWFRRRRFQQVVELGWWETSCRGRLRVTLVPAQHWSRRGLWDTNRSWWGGFVIESDETRIYHAGDSGWFGGFAEIAARFPGLLAALLPIGAYRPAWFMEPNHLNPEQAGQAFLTLAARHLVPMHWGTFQLTDEPLLEPIERLQAWWNEQAGIGSRRLQIPAVGQTVELEE